jgi:hypothetical protein
VALVGHHVGGPEPSGPRPPPHEMIGQPFGERRMGYVQAETRRGWGLGGSPEGDRRGRSLAAARREGPMVGPAQRSRSCWSYCEAPTSRASAAAMA